MQKGRKKWLIALLAALAGAIPVLVPKAAPVSDMLEQTANVLVGSPAPREPVGIPQCELKSWECQQTQSLDPYPQR